MRIAAKLNKASKPKPARIWAAVLASCMVFGLIGASVAALPEGDRRVEKAATREVDCSKQSDLFFGGPVLDRILSFVIRAH